MTRFINYSMYLKSSFLLIYVTGGSMHLLRIKISTKNDVWVAKKVFCTCENTKKKKRNWRNGYLFCHL